MYNIYVNGRRLILLSDNELKTINPKPDKFTIIIQHIHKRKQLRQYIESIIANPEIRTVYIWTEDVQAMWKEFTESFKLVVAAGGLVKNAKGEMLVFLRRGVWDLPKGKIDPGEIPQEAALREVEEECGLTQINLGSFICHSYHIYKEGRKYVLKKTWWFNMTTDQEDVKPQIEEGIISVIWEKPESVRARIHEFYLNLHEVILAG